MSDIHDWTYFAEVGIYKNHTLSSKLMETAVAETIFLQFTDMVEGFGRGKGETVNLMYVEELPNPTNARLTEHMRVPIDKLAWGNVSITVAEWGRGVEYTDLARQLGRFDPKSILQKKLRQQMENAIDSGIAGAMQAAKIVFSPTSPTGGTWATAGTPGALATAALSIDHFGLMRDYLVATIHCPPREGRSWVGVFTPKSLRGIKTDTAFQTWAQYLRRGDVIYNSEVGMIESIRCVECAREEALSNTSGNSTTIGEGLVFGDEWCARVEVEAPELRAKPDYQDDFGRKGAAAWIGTFEFGLFWPFADDKKAKGFRIEST